MIYIHIKKQSYVFTKNHVIVKYVRENRAPAGYSDRFSRSYAMIARFLSKQINWFWLLIWHSYGLHTHKKVHVMT
jgi:hypothetical protein